MIRLLRIVVPGLFSPESGLLVFVATVLVLRTYADVWMIANGTSVEGLVMEYMYIRHMYNVVR